MSAAHATPFKDGRSKTSESGQANEANPMGPDTDSPRVSTVTSLGSPSSLRRADTQDGAFGTLNSFSHLAHRPVPVTVHAAGPGMFKLTAKPDQAGLYALRAGVNSLAAPDSAFLQLPLEVKAAALSPEHCQVVADDKSCSTWIAGGTARLHIKLSDQFGNPVHDVDSSQLDVSCSGPGRVTHSMNYGSRGRCTVTVKLTARAAGRYEVAIRDRLTGKALGGPPVPLVLRPADLNPRMSTFQIRGWQVTGGQATAVAGAEMHLALAIYDIYGVCWMACILHTYVCAHGVSCIAA